MILKEAKQTALYMKIDNLVRHHDRREPYITNVVYRLYMLASGTLPLEAINSLSDYKRGYQAGYHAAIRKKMKPQTPKSLDKEKNDG